MTTPSLDANCWLAGDEDGGVGIHCRICDTGGAPIAYLGWDNTYANVPEVRHVGTSITALIDAGVHHLTIRHGIDET